MAAYAIDDRTASTCSSTASVSPTCRVASASFPRLTYDNVPMSAMATTPDPKLRLTFSYRDSGTTHHPDRRERNGVSHLVWGAPLESRPSDGPDRRRVAMNFSVNYGYYVCFGPERCATLLPGKGC